MLVDGAAVVFQERAGVVLALGLQQHHREPAGIAHIDDAVALHDLRGRRAQMAGDAVEVVGRQQYVRAVAAARLVWNHVAAALRSK